jgi:hypothetical protein
MICTNANTTLHTPPLRIILQWAYAVSHVVLPILYICLAQYTHSSDTVREATVTLGAFNADEINASINGSCDNLSGLNTDIENSPSDLKNKHKTAASWSKFTNALALNDGKLVK